MPTIVSATRLWKSPVESCEYPEHGWPTGWNEEEFVGAKRGYSEDEDLYNACMISVVNGCRLWHLLVALCGSRIASLSPQENASSSSLRRPAFTIAASSTTGCRPPPENQRKVLRVLIKKKEHLACPDSGSAKNIMSESLANKCGLKIRRSSKDIKQFELGSGKCISSIGRVRIPVELLGNTLGRKKCWFYIFSTCPVPLILGMPFLEEAGILTKNRRMLESCPAELSNISSLLWIGSSRSNTSPRNQFECSLDGHDLEAVADTGSDLNLMSLKCAKREGFRIDRRREARRRIRVGDATEAETVGQVYIYKLNLDWRKAPTTPDIPININNRQHSP